MSLASLDIRLCGITGAAKRNTPVVSTAASSTISARHQHEYETLRRHPPPDSMILIPGVIDNMTKHLEHPEVVAERIQRAVDAVGERERVIAGVDCGFAVFTDNAMMTEDICWAKFSRLRAGADLASSRLWG